MKIKKTIKYIFLALVFVSLVFFSVSFLAAYKNIKSAKNETASISNEQNGGKISSSAGRVLGEEESLPTGQAGDPISTQLYSSQNFRMPQITFGGDAITFPSGQQSNAPEILEMRSELLMTKRDQQVKFILSWKTNKPCQSAIKYAREGQEEGKTVSEDGYGFVHSVEVAPLNYSMSYSYVVTAKDKWGNETNSDKLSFYTGAPNVSIFDLLGGAFQDMFGWAGK